MGAALALSSGSAAADDADDLIREGVALRRKRDDAEALKKFQQAAEISASPRVMAQMGLAEQALGRWAMAHEHLSQALEGKSDPWIKKNLAAISQSLSRVDEHVGYIEILGGPPGAEVRIDSVSRGKLPLAHPLAASTGVVTIDLVSPGFDPVRRTTVVRAREAVRESFESLPPLSVKEPSRPAPSRAAGGEGPAVAGSEPEAPRTSPGGNSLDRGGGRPGSLRSKAKWVALGLGAAALGVGIVGGVRQHQAGGNFAGGCRVDESNDVVVLPGSGKTEADCRSLRSQVDSNYRLELAGLVGAGVLVTAGVVLWLTEPKAGDPSGETPRETTAASLSCVPTLAPGYGAAMGCSVRF